MKYDYIIVGAGFFGSVIAEQIARIMKKKVLVIDKRNHVGGNCFTELDKKTGEIKWQKIINSNDIEEFQLKYTARYPKNKELLLD